jgi:HEAT repeat protein
MAWLLLLAVYPGCATNINDLLKETHEGDPDAVHEAITGIGEILRQKELAGESYTRGDEAGLAYLKEVAGGGSSDLNRARAVASLGRLERLELIEVFLARLNDPFWAVRLEAARALARRPVPSAAPQLAQRLEMESRAEVRLNLIRALAQAGGEDALRALLKVIIDVSGKFDGMKLTAYDAVKELSEKNFDLEDDSTWRSYYRERFENTDRSAPQNGAAPGDASPPGKTSPAEKPANGTP